MKANGLSAVPIEVAQAIKKSVENAKFMTKQSVSSGGVANDIDRSAVLRGGRYGDATMIRDEASVG